VRVCERERASEIERKRASESARYPPIFLPARPKSTSRQVPVSRVYRILDSFTSLCTIPSCVYAYWCVFIYVSLRVFVLCGCVLQSVGGRGHEER